MGTTKVWAESLDVSGEPDLPPVADYSQPYVRSASEVAVRAVILQGVVAIAYGVEVQPVVDWFEEQGIWSAVTPQERIFISNPERTEREKSTFRWKQEAEWTLLWMIHRVESLGLPTRFCDTRRLVDEIVPPLGDNIQSFINQSELRAPGALLAEDDRSYNLWCYAHAASRRRENLPVDFNLGILRERRYAFEWMDGIEDWDDVTCDS